MDIVRLREKIVEFTKTDWKKYPTYEHALQEWAESLLEEETKGLKNELAARRMLAEAKQLLDGSKINPDDRYEITEKGKEYLRSH